MGQQRSKTTTFQAEVDRITKIVSKEIYSGDRLPNEHLIENNLGEMYSVSRMIIRQVLVKLETAGLATIEPYKGATVSPVTIGRIKEEYEIVGMLEGFSAQLAIQHISNKDIEKMERIIEQQKKIKENESEKWEKLNREFHSIINRNSRNNKLKKLIIQNISFTNYWFLSFPFNEIYQNVKAHERILQAIKKKDIGKVRKEMEDHIINACDTLIEHIQKSIPLGAFR